MSQTFNLKLATDSLSSDAKNIGVTVQQLLQIEVKVSAEILDLDATDNNESVNSSANASLSLSYQIKLPSIPLIERLQWPLWDKEKVGFNDYLWEQTCLECFITNSAASYVEINASPNGRYAVYAFDDYRTPSTLPPLPLLIENNKDRASIQWANTDAMQNEPMTYTRRFFVPLAQLPCDLLIKDNKALIHPCVILYFGKVALYFAPAHTSPADFHNRQYWSAIDDF